MEVPSLSALKKFYNYNSTSISNSPMPIYRSIPEDYSCHFSLKLDPSKLYNIEIERKSDYLEMYSEGWQENI
jgi:hypothetical protein